MAGPMQPWLDSYGFQTLDSARVQGREGVVPLLRGMQEGLENDVKTVMALMRHRSIATRIGAGHPRSGLG